MDSSKKQETDDWKIKTKYNLKSNELKWNGYRKYDSKNLQLKIGQADIFSHFEFYSKNDGIEQWGKSKKFGLELIARTDRSESVLTTGLSTSEKSFKQLYVVILIFVLTIIILSFILWCIINRPCIFKKQEKVFVEEKIIDEEASVLSPQMPYKIAIEDQIDFS